MKLIEALQFRLKVLEAEHQTTLTLIKEKKLGRNRFSEVNRAKYEIEEIKILIEKEKEKENGK